MQKANKPFILRSVCVLVSLILLSANWLVTTGKTQYDWSEYQENIRDGINELAWMVRDEDIFIDLEDVQTIAFGVIDGKLSAAESFKLCRAGESLLKDVHRFLMTEFDVPSDEVSAIPKIRVGCISYTAVFLTLIMSGAITLVQSAKGKHGWYEYVFFACQLIILLLCLFVIRKLRATDYPIYLKITVPAVFAVLLSFPTAILSKAPAKRLMFQIGQGLPEGIRETHPVEFVNTAYGKIKASKFPKRTKWVCGQCGAEMAPTDTFCGKCGASVQTMEMKSKVCPKCGCSVDVDSSFCSYCGAQL